MATRMTRRQEGRDDFERRATRTYFAGIRACSPGGFLPANAPHSPLRAEVRGNVRGGKDWRLPPSLYWRGGGRGWRDQRPGTSGPYFQPLSRSRLCPGPWDRCPRGDGRALREDDRLQPWQGRLHASVRSGAQFLRWLRDSGRPFTDVGGDGARLGLPGSRRGYPDYLRRWRHGHG